MIDNWRARKQDCDLALDIFNARSRETVMPRAASDKVGMIYLVRLHPSNRYKVGFTENEATLAGRMKEARTWVPEATPLRTWPALEKHEALVRYVMQSRLPVARALGEFPFSDWSRNAGGEVIDGDSEIRLIERADSLFNKFLFVEDEEDERPLTLVRKGHGG